jgi:hypothetical protein
MMHGVGVVAGMPAADVGLTEAIHVASLPGNHRHRNVSAWGQPSDLKT